VATGGNSSVGAGLSVSSAPRLRTRKKVVRPPPIKTNARTPMMASGGPWLAGRARGGGMPGAGPGPAIGGAPAYGGAPYGDGGPPYGAGGPPYAAGGPPYGAGGAGG